MLKPDTKNIFLPNLIRTGGWREIGFVCLMIMDLIWMGILYKLIADPGPHLSRIFLVTAGGIFISHYLSRFLNIRNSPIRVRRIIYTLWIMSFLFICQRFIFASAMAVDLPIWAQMLGSDSIDSFGFENFLQISLPILTVYRGVYFAGVYLDPKLFTSNFVLGLVIIGLAGLYSSLLTLVSHLVLYFAFLLSGLIGSVFTRIHIVAEQRGGKIPPLNAKRSIEMLTILSGIILSGMLIGWIFGYPLIGFSQNLILGIFSLIIIVIGFLMSPVLLLLFFFFDRLASLLPQNEFIPIAADVAGGLMEDLNNLAGEGSPILERVFDLGVLAVWVGIIALLVFLIYLGLQWSKNSQVIQTEENIGSLHPLKTNQKKSPKIWTRLWKFDSLRKHYYANRIRAIYAQFLRLSADLGTVRKPSQTPIEFLHDTLPKFPEFHRELQLITTSYIRIRYGELPETEEDYNLVDSAWKSFKKWGGKQKTKSRKQAKRN